MPSSFAKASAQRVRFATESAQCEGPARRREKSRPDAQPRV